MDYDAIMQDLLEATDASRTTLRLDHPTLNYPVAGEACARGCRVDPRRQLDRPARRRDGAVDPPHRPDPRRRGRPQQRPGAAAGDRRRLRPALVPAHPAAQEVRGRAARLDLGAREPRHAPLDRRRPDRRRGRDRARPRGVRRLGRSVRGRLGRSGRRRRRAQAENSPRSSRWTSPPCTTPTTPVRAERDVGERVAVDHDEVGELARLDRADRVRRA